RREASLTADRRQTDAIAVPADAGDDLGEKVAITRRLSLRSAAGSLERAEAQRVQQRDGLGAHGEDIAYDAAHAGGGALQGLDRRGVVVRLDLHRDQNAVADGNGAGVLLTGAGLHLRRLRGEERQQGSTVLVAAMLAPQRPEHAQLDLVRLPSEALDHK